MKKSREKMGNGQNGQSGHRFIKAKRQGQLPVKVPAWMVKKMGNGQSGHKFK